MVAPAMVALQWLYLLALHHPRSLVSGPLGIALLILSADRRAGFTSEKAVGSATEFLQVLGMSPNACSISS